MSRNKIISQSNYLELDGKNWARHFHMGEITLTPMFVDDDWYFLFKNAIWYFVDGDGKQKIDEPPLSEKQYQELLKC